MLICANEYALNKYLDKQAKYETTCELFNEAIQDALKEIESNIEFIQAMAEDFNGYNLSNYADECISEVIR